MDNFGERLKGLLKIKGSNQSDFAASLGLSQARFNNYLNGKTEASYLVLTAIADKLDVTIDYLLGLSSDASSSQENMFQAIKPIFAQTIDEGEDDFSTIVWIPAYNTISQGEIKDAKGKSPDGWVKSDTMNMAVHKHLHYLIQSDDSMEPIVTQGDKLLVASAAYIFPAIENIDSNALYAVKYEKGDNIGLNIRHCMVKDGVIFIRPAGSKYPSVAFNLQSIDFSPIAGKIISIFR